MSNLLFIQVCRCHLLRFRVFQLSVAIGLRQFKTGLSVACDEQYN